MMESSDQKTSKGSSYIIQGGHQGADRLKVLTDATWRTTEPFLHEAGLRSGVHCLDLGCGSGEITKRMVPLVGANGKVAGVDFDQKIIEIARAEAAAKGLGISFQTSNIESEDLSGGPYDFVFARFFLSHLKKPEAAIEKIKNVLRPGGSLAVEDVDFHGHFCHPDSHAFERYVELYARTGIQNGVDPYIGPRLPELLEGGGFKEVKLNVVLPTFKDGEGKTMALLTLSAIQEAVVAKGLADRVEVQNLLTELAQFTNDARSIMSLARIFQVWGVAGC